MSIGQIIFSWLDLFWFPMALLIVNKGQRIKAAVFVFACVFILRLQVELFEELGAVRGFLNILETPLLHRGYITYSVFICSYLVLAHLSPRVNPFVFMAASITIFITAFCVSSVIMVL